MHHLMLSRLAVLFFAFPLFSLAQQYSRFENSYLPEMPIAGLEFVDLERHSVLSEEYPFFGTLFSVSKINKDPRYPGWLINSSIWYLGYGVVQETEKMDFSNSNGGSIEYWADSGGWKKKKNLYFTIKSITTGQLKPNAVNIIKHRESLEPEYTYLDTDVYSESSRGEPLYLIFIDDMFVYSTEKELLNKAIEVANGLHPPLKITEDIKQCIDELNELTLSFWGIRFPRSAAQTRIAVAINADATEEEISRLTEQAQSQHVIDYMTAYIDKDGGVVQTSVSFYEDEKLLKSAYDRYVNGVYSGINRGKASENKSSASYFKFLEKSTEIFTHDNKLYFNTRWTSSLLNSRNDYYQQLKDAQAKDK